MKCAFVTIPFRGLMSVNRSNPKSVTYVSGTFVTLDSGLYTFVKGGTSVGNQQGSISLPFYASRLTPHVSRLRKMHARYTMSGMTA